MKMPVIHLSDACLVYETQFEGFQPGSGRTGTFVVCEPRVNTVPAMNLFGLIQVEKPNALELAKSSFSNSLLGGNDCKKTLFFFRRSKSPKVGYFACVAQACSSLGPLFRTSSLRSNFDNWMYEAWFFTTALLQVRTRGASWARNARSRVR